jgi:CRP-like cAMP-binding protein
MAPKPEQKGSKDYGPAEREALLKQTYIFAGAPDDIISRLTERSHVVKVKRGERVFEQHDEGDTLYGVFDGAIKISVSGPGGKEYTITIMEPGDVFGEIALLDGLPRTADATAVQDTVLLSLHRSHFLPILEDDPRLARHLVEMLCERLRLANENTADVAFLSLEKRLAKRLLGLAMSYGRQTDEGLLIELKLSQNDLAMMTSATREAINKQLHTFIEDGLIRLDKRQITVRDTKGLQAILEAEED